MKNLFFLLSTFLFSPAIADGFICRDEEEIYEISVFNHNDPTIGTREVKSLKIDDLEHDEVFLNFTPEVGSLKSNGTYYSMSVDRRFGSIRDSAIHLFSQAIQEFEKIYLGVDFSYAQPIEDGSIVDGKLWGLDRKTRLLSEMPLNCERVLIGAGSDS